MSLLVVFIRYLIGFAFLPSGMVKVMGERFTQLGVDDPVGYFFEAMYQTGFYWNFLGIAQVIAAFLLITQRYATVGALLYFALIANIFLITVSVGFTGTWVITMLMLIAAISLVLWDWNKIRFLFYRDNFQFTVPTPKYIEIAKVWSIAGMVFFWSFLSYYLLVHFIGFKEHNDLLMIVGVSVLALNVASMLYAFLKDRKTYKKRLAKPQ